MPLLLALLLPTCVQDPSDQDPFFIHGKILLGKEKPLSGVRIKGSVHLNEGGEFPREVDLGEATSAEDGAFRLAVPAQARRDTAARTCWGWWVDLDVSHPEYKSFRKGKTDTWEALAKVTITFTPPSPDLEQAVRRRLEGLRSSPHKKCFTYGIDPGWDLDEADVEVFDFLDEACRVSQRAVDVLKEYEKDRDANVKALAYEVLAQHWESEDDAGRPPDAKSAEEAFKGAEWMFQDVRKSKHGGHYALAGC